MAKTAFRAEQMRILILLKPTNTTLIIFSALVCIIMLVIHLILLSNVLYWHDSLKYNYSEFSELLPSKRLVTYPQDSSNIFWLPDNEFRFNKVLVLKTGNTRRLQNMLIILFAVSPSIDLIQ